MEVFENKTQWSVEFGEGWLAHLDESGETDFSLYRHPKNLKTPGAPGVKLSASRLMMISSAGGYLPETQEPFDAPSLYGDYTVRTFPASTSLDALAYAHEHYDHVMIDEDPQVALPLRYLEDLVSDGEIGELAPSVVSFMGYQPDSARVVDVMIPEIVAIAQAGKIDAALLAPV